MSDTREGPDRENEETSLLDEPRRKRRALRVPVDDVPRPSFVDVRPSAPTVPATAPAPTTLAATTPAVTTVTPSSPPAALADRPRSAPPPPPERPRSAPPPPPAARPVVDANLESSEISIDESDAIEPPPPARPSFAPPPAPAATRAAAPPPAPVSAFDAAFGDASASSPSDAPEAWPPREWMEEEPAPLRAEPTKVGKRRSSTPPVDEAPKSSPSERASTPPAGVFAPGPLGDASVEVPLDVAEEEPPRATLVDTAHLAESPTAATQTATTPTTSTATTPTAAEPKTASPDDDEPEIVTSSSELDLDELDAAAAALASPITQPVAPVAVVPAAVVVSAPVVVLQQPVAVVGTPARPTRDETSSASAPTTPGGFRAPEPDDDGPALTLDIDEPTPATVTAAAPVTATVTAAAPATATVTAAAPATPAPAVHDDEHDEPEILEEEATPPPKAAPAPKVAQGKPPAPPPSAKTSSPSLPPIQRKDPAAAAPATSPSAAAPPAAAPPATQAAALDPITTSRPPKKKLQWWEELFNDDYLRTVPIPHPKAVLKQTDFIESRLGLAKGSTILDVGCGLGLHAIELTRRGYLVVGLDLSLPMLSRAADEAQDQGFKINFLHADMREMNFEGAFDAVLLWGTTLGYFDDDANRQVIERIYRALKPGGLLLLEVVNRDFAVKSQPNLVWFQGDGCVVMEETSFNFINSRLLVKRNVILDDNRQKESNYSLRLYSLHELGLVLHQRGFRVVEVSGREATPGVYFGADSPKLIILAERRVQQAPPAPPKKADGTDGAPSTEVTLAGTGAPT